jgi:ABC-type nickel/cobalt efflux system permease component RcnA
MSKSKALALVIAIFSLLVVVAYMGLTFAHATSEILTAAIVLISCLGAHMVSRVVMHYPPHEHRNR